MESEQQAEATQFMMAALNGRKDITAQTVVIKGGNAVRMTIWIPQRKDYSTVIHSHGR